MAKRSGKMPSFEPPADSTTSNTDWAGPAAKAKAAPKTSRSPKTTTKAARPAAASAATKAPGADSRNAGANVLIARYAKYSAAAGLVPMVAVDVAAIAGVQVAMLGGLAKHYGVPFTRERGKTVISALLGSLMPALAGHQAMKVVGTVVGMISLAGFAFAATSAVGRVFVAHFESGGTLDSFDPKHLHRILSKAPA